MSPSLVVEELLGGSFLRLDSGDPDGALACALRALQLSAGPSAAVAAQQAASHTCAVQVCEEILRRGGILADMGHGALLRRELEDGTSVVCTRCGALVARQRMEAHRVRWCAMLGDDWRDAETEACGGPSKGVGMAAADVMEVDDWQTGTGTLLPPPELGPLSPTSPVGRLPRAAAISSRGQGPLWRTPVT
eukprot:CAMPEP_0171217830 /NCGR_PEP_ID=MMETSP0790-20130122/32891_1 /TAXON_ID=2925 /ORGANISM="Alexandrium catenella, Strain OF101" /LENGTH=190 /DNA_ID=CAMNT_0011683639 /DNA_START=16 /DNA_END=586 /DNA_ORIENTATION=+